MFLCPHLEDEILRAKDRVTESLFSNFHWLAHYCTGKLMACMIPVVVKTVRFGKYPISIRHCTHLIVINIISVKDNNPVW